MRFVLALVAFVIAALMIATGVAQRTIFLPSNKVVATAQIPAGARYVVISGSALDAHDGRQRVSISGSSTVFAAYGRTADVTAWLAGQRYVRVGIDQSSGNFAEPVSAIAPKLAGIATGGAADPNGSDLWYDQRRVTSATNAAALHWTVNVPSTVSLLVASNGTSAAPRTVSISWPVTVSTPFATPLIVGGSVLVIVGLILYILALLHWRRRRGPRRKQPPRMPRPPQPPKYKAARVPRPVAAKGRRAVRRTALTAGAIALTGVVLTGCAPANTPAAAPSASPTRAVVPTIPPAVTAQQARRIVSRAATVAAAADASLSATTLEQRFAGPALALRTAAYTAQKRDKSIKLPQAIPTKNATVKVILPQATTTWPRTMFAVVSDTSAGSTVPPLGLTFVQATPRDQFQVQYEMALEPGAELPALPAPEVGAARIAANSTLLSVAPASLAADYGALLRDDQASVASEFDTENDDLLKDVGEAAKKKVAKALGSTAKITFSDAATPSDSIVALATAESGAIVSVSLSETWTVKPAKTGVSVKPSGATKALSKVSTTTKGIASTYGYQLLFSVPPAGSKQPVVLLGYAQGLIQAKEL